MCYTEEEIAKFIEILKSGNKSPKSNKVSCKYCNCSIFFLFNPVITIVQIVLLVWVMFLVIMIKLSMKDLTFAKNPFIKESITIRTRLNK